MKAGTTPESGDTSSRKWLQVAGIWVLLAAPLDQESPGSPQKVAFGSSPGGAMPTVNNRGRLFWGSAWTARALEGQLEARWLLGSRRALPICGGCVSNCVSYHRLTRGRWLRRPLELGNLAHRDFVGMLIPQQRTRITPSAHRCDVLQGCTKSGRRVRGRER